MSKKDCDAVDAVAFKGYVFFHLFPLLLLCVSSAGRRPYLLHDYSLATAVGDIITRYSITSVKEEGPIRLVRKKTIKFVSGRRCLSNTTPVFR